MKRSALKKRKSKVQRRSSGAGRGRTVHTAEPQGSRSTPERPRLGLEASVEMPVSQERTIQSFDSRLPPVLSTPAMIGLMEVAAAQAVQPELPPGAITVGTRIEVDHLKAVGLGSMVRAHARLVGHEGRFLVFEVDAHSLGVLVGRGRVFRAIVESAKFTPPV